MKDPFDPEKTIEAVWCVHSETSDEVLIDLHTNKIIARRINSEIVPPF